jgi:hypothetical protein
MLVLIVFKILGLGVLGALVGILTTPFVLYMLQALAYMLALMVVLLRATLASHLTVKEALNVFPQFVKEFPKYADEPVSDGKNGKPSIEYPNPSKHLRQSIQNGRRVNISKQADAYKGWQASNPPNNQGIRDMPKQPIIKETLNAVCNLFHSVLLFYKSYYGHSTKVEKNPLATDPLTCLLCVS